MFAQQAFAWLLTYLLHSTLLLSLAWLASKPLARWSVSAEEAAWKVALVGALLTASVQLAAGWEPAAGRWHLAAAPVERTAAAVPVESALTAPPALPVRASEAPAVPSMAASALPAAPAARAAHAASVSVPAVLLGLWACGATLLLALYGRAFLRIRHRLQTRPRVVGGRLSAQLAELARRAGFETPVRLSCSSRVPVPLALGVRRPEICLPPRALAGLTAEQQEGMLAHELAHLVRRDPLWLVLGHGIAAVLFFQPLNWVARRRLREISEMLSDEWAVGRTGRPLSLAGCLAEVAGWSAYRPLPVPGMSDRPSSLARRIRRLLDEGRSPEHPSRRLWIGAVMVALLIAVAAAAPAVSAARPETPDSTKAPKAEAAAAAEAHRSAAPADDSWLDARPAHDHDATAADHQLAAREDAERAAAEEAEADDDDSSADVDVDVDVDPEDISASVDAAFEQASASLDAAMEGLAGDRDGDSPRMSEEDREKLERDMERRGREIQERIQPRIERLSREMSEKMSRLHAEDPEMARLAREMSKLAESMRPSDEEIARLSAAAEKMRADGKLTREERDRLREDARRLSESARPTAEQRRQMEALRDQMHRRGEEMGKEFRAEHQAEIEKAQADMRRDVERELAAAREEIRRSVEDRRAAGHDRREHAVEMREKAREKAREKVREKHERRHGQSDPCDDHDHDDDHDDGR